MMKLQYALSLLIGLLLSVSAWAQNEPTKPAEGPVMTFETKVVDYGDIERKSERKRTLKFTNTGTEPLVISNARGSCGCTVPTWPKEPIMPGESSEMVITYDTNRPGKINKTVTITTNEGANPHVIKVVGHVHEPTQEEGVPANKSGIIPNNGNN